MKKIFTILVVCLSFLAVFNAFAGPAYPFPIEVLQPDGSVLTIRLHGDEHFGYTTTEDGYLLQQTQQGGYEYAQIVDNEIISTGILARNNRSDAELALISILNKEKPVFQATIELFRENSNLKRGAPQRLSKNPLFGTKKGIAILVNFTDKSFTYSRQNFDNLLNQTGYSANNATGCAREYFEVSTFNQFSPEFDVYGPYNLSHDMAYYGARNGSNNDSRVGEMIIEACQKALEAGVDFSQYDTDNNGTVDQVFVYYAGNNEAEGGGSNTIWPHRSVVSTSLTFNEKSLRDYACSSEMRGSGGTMCGIGTFCHEFGHILGLPDLYDTSPANSNTIGYWDIMCSGGYNNGGSTPPTYSAWERFYLGYITPRFDEKGGIEVLSAEGEYMLEPLITSNKAYIIAKDDIHNLNGASPNPKEFFIVENHQNIGWDASSKSTYEGTLGHGLLVTRINYVSSAYAANTVNNNNTALGVDIIEADGSYGSFGGDTYPGTNNKVTFVPKYIDGSLYEDGTLLDIREELEDLIFCFRTCGGIRPNVNILPETTEFKTVAGTPSATSRMRIVGSKLENDIKLTFTTANNNYQMKFADSDTWKQTLSIQLKTISDEPLVMDSVIDTLIDVRYNPVQPSYKEVHQNFIQAKSVVGNTPVKRVQLTGKSTRKVSVVPPPVKDFSKLSPYAFQVNWKKVYDAVGYYVTVYSTDGQTTETEDFEEFDNIASSGWNQTFYTTTNVAIPSKPAVLFTSMEDTLYTPYYPEAVTEIKFWIRSEDKSKEGSFFIEGLNGDVWDTVAIVPVTMSLTGVSKTFKSELENKDYRRFRFSVFDISKKGVVFDDFSATYNAKVVLNRSFVESKYKANSFDSLRIINLLPNTDYICKVQATDKDSEDRYENVTDYSDAVDVKTMYGEDVDSRHISTIVRADGSVLVSINDADVKDLDIYIYSLTGQLIRHIPNSDFKDNPGEITVSGLQNNNSYIISLGSKRKSKYAKVVIK
jgi:M6 family metalloprotease-like protein